MFSVVKDTKTSTLSSGQQVAHHAVVTGVYHDNLKMGKACLKDMACLLQSLRQDANHKPRLAPRTITHRLLPF